MADAPVPNKGLEAKEVDQALDGSIVIPSCSKASDPKGDVIGNYFILPNGSTLDIQAHVAELVSKELAKRSAPSFVRVGEQDTTSITGSQSHGSVKRPHDLSDESDSEAYSDNDLGLGEVLGAGINDVPMLAGLGDDELSGTTVQESSSGNTLPCTTQITEPITVSATSDDQSADIDPDLPSLKQNTQNFFS